MDVVHVYPFYHRLGGVEKYILDTLPMQRKKKRTFRLLGGEFEESVIRDYTCIKACFLKWPKVLVTLTFALGAEMSLRRMRPSPAGRFIVHSQGASCFWPDLVTAHSCHTAWFSRSLGELRPLSPPWWKKILNPIHYATIFVEWFQYRLSKNTHVIAISNCIKHELQEFFGLSDDRITVIHSGVDCEKYDPLKKSAYRATIRREHGLSEEHVVLLFVANEFRRKGLTYLLSAMKLVNQSHLKLLVVGKDDPQPYRRIADKLGIAGQLIFVGPTPDVDQYYAAADIFVLPTVYEPFGLVITEAMAAGLPVVVSALAGAAELASDGTDSVLIQRPDDPGELALAINQLLDAKTRKDMGRRARETAERNSWESVVDKIEEIYGMIELKLTEKN